MRSIFTFIFLILCSSVFASAPKVGKAAAARYFQNEKKAERQMASAEGEDLSSGPSSSSRSLNDHYMSLGFGTFADNSAYNWGQNGREDKIGKWGVDLTYRMTEQEYLFDQSLKISYVNYHPANQDTNKLSFMYAITFPEAGSKFPLYFGGAAGPGVYLKQIDEESVLSLDYQLFIGLRMFNVFDRVGFYVEGGLRNHLHLTSDGQFNGTFLSLGSIFVF